MKLLEHPEARYGPLPTPSYVKRELKPHTHLQTPEGALEYLELHLNRVQECYDEISNPGTNIWFWLSKRKATTTFVNTTRALRVIIAWHGENQELLAKMRQRLQDKANMQDDLAPHYNYVLSLLAELLARNEK